MITFSYYHCDYKFTINQDKETFFINFNNTIIPITKEEFMYNFNETKTWSTLYYAKLIEKHFAKEHFQKHGNSENYKNIFNCFE